MSTHGVLTERSVSGPVVTHDRKGREGKGIGGECLDVVPIHRCSLVRGRPPHRWMAADAAMIGGRA